MSPGHKYSVIESFLFPTTRMNKEMLHDELQTKTVLITGASYGIGESLALTLAYTGAHLILVARTEEKLRSVKNEIEQLGGKATIHKTDLSVPEQVQQLSDFVKRLPGGVDIVISNAGKSIRRSIKDSLDRNHDFTRSMSLNYSGPVQLLLSMIPVLEKNKGHIINISAINVLLAPAPYWAAYQASMTAIDQWFRCAAPELNACGIDTTSIYLPLVKTRMISPTPAYEHLPAMTTGHVAAVIGKCIYSKKKKYTPWWLPAAQIASYLFRRRWESLTINYLQKK